MMMFGGLGIGLGLAHRLLFAGDKPFRLFKPAAYMEWMLVWGLAICVTAALERILGVSLFAALGEWLPWREDPQAAQRSPFFQNVKFIEILLAYLWGLVAAFYSFLVLYWLAGRWRMAPGVQTSFDAQVFIGTLGYRFWVLGIPMLWLLAFQLIPDEPVSGLLHAGEFSVILDNSTPLIGVSWMVVIALGIAAGISFARFSNDGEGNPAARLVVSPLLMWTGNLTFLLVTILFFAPLFTGVDLMSLLQQRNDALQGFGLAATYVAAFGAFFFRDNIRIIIDYALDVANYFDEGGIPGGDPERRMRIRNRFQTIVDDVLDGSEKRDEHHTLL